MLFATQTVLGLTVLGNFLLLTIASKKTKSPSRRIFCFAIGSIFIWSFGIFLNTWFESLFVERAIFASAALFLTFQVWFVRIFPKRKPNRSDLFFVFPGLFFTAASFVPGALFYSIDVTPFGYTILDTGPLSVAYSLFALIYVSIPSLLLWQKYNRTSNAIIKHQLWYLFVGFFIFLAVNIFTNLILPVFFGIFFLNAIGPAFSLLLAGTVFYIITKHQFLDTYGVVRTLKEKVRERTEEIGRLQREQKQLMIDISHGIQTPLTVMRGMIETLKKENPTDSRLEACERSVDMISKLTYDLLTLARVEAREKTQIKNEPVNVSMLLLDLLEYVSVSASVKHITLQSDVVPNIFVRGAKERLSELFLNLFSNAVKYMGERNARREISIILKEEKERVVFSIKDTGKGIAPEHLPRIFDRFYRVRADDESSMPGTGIGLAIANAITISHGGNITVSSVEGRGTKFTVTLPLFLNKE